MSFPPNETEPSGTGNTMEKMRVYNLLFKMMDFAFKMMDFAFKMMNFGRSISRTSSTGSATR